VCRVEKCRRSLVAAECCGHRVDDDLLFREDRALAGGVDVVAVFLRALGCVVVGVDPLLVFGDLLDDDDLHADPEHGSVRRVAEVERALVGPTTVVAVVLEQRGARRGEQTLRSGRGQRGVRVVLGVGHVVDDAGGHSVPP
jgi:hypothetical protein